MEKCALKFPKDEEGLYRIHINVRCEPAFFFALQLAYKRLTHQGDASLIRKKHQKAEIKLVAALSLSGVKIILYFAKFYGMRGVYEELERLVCNNDFLRYCHSERTGRNIQRYFASKSKKPANPTKGGNGFQQYVTGLSPYETGLYLVNLELAKQRQELKAAQLAVYHASLDETIDKKVNRKKIPVPPGKLPHTLFLSS